MKMCKMKMSILDYEKSFLVFFLSLLFFVGCSDFKQDPLRDYPQTRLNTVNPDEVIPPSQIPDEVIVNLVTVEIPPETQVSSDEAISLNILDENCHFDSQKEMVICQLNRNNEELNSVRLAVEVKLSPTLVEENLLTIDQLKLIVNQENMQFEQLTIETIAEPNLDFNSQLYNVIWTANDENDKMIVFELIYDVDDNVNQDLKNNIKSLKPKKIQIQIQI